VIKEHLHEELKCTMHKETLLNLGCEIETEDQVSNFLHCCLRFLNDLDATKMLTHMLATCMGEYGKEREI
jgi:hypothetical protein